MSPIMGHMPTSSRSALVLVASASTLNLVERVELLERSGHRVLEAVDGVHALALATRYLPDVIAADLLLPRLDGLDLSARLAASPDLSDLPIVLVRDPASTVESWNHGQPLVASADELLTEVRRFVTARTPLVESRRTLRRALAGVRANADSHCEAA